MVCCHRNKMWEDYSENFLLLSAFQLLWSVTTSILYYIAVSYLKTVSLRHVIPELDNSSLTCPANHQSCCTCKCVLSNDKVLVYLSQFRRYTAVSPSAENSVQQFDFPLLLIPRTCIHMKLLKLSLFVCIISLLCYHTSGKQAIMLCAFCHLYTTR